MTVSTEPRIAPISPPIVNCSHEFQARAEEEFALLQELSGLLSRC